MPLLRRKLLDKLLLVRERRAELLNVKQQFDSRLDVRWAGSTEEHMKSSIGLRKKTVILARNELGATINAVLTDRSCQTHSYVIIIVTLTKPSENYESD